MGGREAQGVTETSAAGAEIPQGRIEAWLRWLNAILEVAYSPADVETGC